MDAKTYKFLYIILCIFLLSQSFFILSEQGNNKFLLSILLLCLCLSYVSAHMLKQKLGKSIGSYKILFDSALVYWIMLLDKSWAAEILFFLLIGYAIIYYPIKKGILFTILSFISYAVISYIKLGHPKVPTFFPQVTGYALNFVFVYGFIFIAKYQIIQRDKLHQTTLELEAKSRELEKAYLKLQESFDAKEELAITKERNRIAGEIHDTVGHTLTTVLVELEASKRLITKNKLDLSYEKLDLAQEQVRKGLNDIRKSVRMLKEGEDLLSFVPSLKALIHETEKHGGVRIEHTIEEIPMLNENIEKVIYRVLQEGLTNGIRHGKSNHFQLSIKCENNLIFLKLKDNGCGFESLKPGFGLSNMEHRIKQLNGKMTIDSIFKEGCTLSIEIPIKE